MKITGIDHIALQVRDLETAVAGYQAVFGRAPAWRGDFGGGVRHAWFQFPDVALDVIGGDGQSEGARAITADIDKHGEGIWGVGFTVEDLDAARHTLERRGVELAPSHVTRSRNAAGEERSWQIAIARRRSSLGVAQFFVQQKAAAWPESEPIAHGPVSGLDHVVVHTANPDRALAHYGAQLGLDLRLDRANPQWRARQMFFRCGAAIVEIGMSLKAPVSDEPDRYGGLAWRVREPEAARARIAAAGLNVSELRKGRKPGTSVFTVRTGSVPTLMLAGND